MFSSQVPAVNLMMCLNLPSARLGAHVGPTDAVGQACLAPVRVHMESQQQRAKRQATTPVRRNHTLAALRDDSSRFVAL